MTGAAALAGVIVVIAGAMFWAARLVHVGYLDVQSLMDKIGVAEPASALDWPEMRVRELIPQPDGPPLVLLDVRWPAHPRQASTLLMALDSGDRQALSLLSRWRAGQAPVTPLRQDGAELDLRRRQSLERVHAVLVAEDYRVASSG